MQHLFVSHQIALLAKEKGFDEPCFAYWNDSILLYQFPKNSWHGYEDIEQINFNVDEEDIAAPLYQQLIDWFREEHKIEIYCLKQIEENEYGGIVGWSGIEEYSTKSCDADYYKALNKAIEEAFELI
jgi:hypothetical protein